MRQEIDDRALVSHDWIARRKGREVVLHLGGPGQRPFSHFHCGKGGYQSLGQGIHIVSRVIVRRNLRCDITITEVLRVYKRAMVDDGVAERWSARYAQYLRDVMCRIDDCLGRESYRRDVLPRA